VWGIRLAQIKKCEQFSAMRDSILNNIKTKRKILTKEDIFISTATEQCLEVLRDMSSARVGIEY